MGRVVAGIGIAAFLVIFSWEFAARKNDIWFRPTWVIDQCTALSRRIWTVVGRGAAFVSAFVEWLDFTELVETFQALACSLWTLVKSPFVYFFSGYTTKALTYARPFMVGIGSGLLAGAIGGYGLHRFWPWSRTAAVGVFYRSLYSFWIPALTTFVISTTTVLCYIDLHRQTPASGRRH